MKLPQLPPQPQLQIQEARIQITPVDDGYVIQGQSIDGQRKHVRNVASSPDEMRLKVHKIVDQLFIPTEPQAPPTATTPTDTGGPAGTESPS